MKAELSVQNSPPGDLQGKIVAAARARFRQFGYAKTSMQEIADDCAMSAANLYRYYEGKLAIGLAVNRELRSEWFAECDRAVQRSEPEVARALIALFHASIDATRRQIKQAPLLFELGMTVARERPELRLEILAEMKRRIAALLAAGQQRGQIQAADPEQLAQLILLASAPFVLPWMLQTQPFGNPRAQVQPLMQCLISGLKAVDSPRAAEAIT